MQNAVFRGGAGVERGCDFHIVMNYRHAFHAGNHTEVFKHSVLVRLILHLLKKERPFMVLDTHAGIGLYDLQSDEAMRTKEADEGVRKVVSAKGVVLTPYLDLVRSFGGQELRYYPGSPSLIRALLRPSDRLIACELHEDDVVQLRKTFRGDRRVSVHARDGYEAVLAFVPPSERRGLVFVDPPFEEHDEFETLAKQLIAAYSKWPTGIFAAWYPIKDKSVVRPFIETLRSAYIKRCLSVELLRYALDDVRLAGSGMIVVNPPWQLDLTLNALCAELLSAFEATEGHSSVEWLN